MHTNEMLAAALDEAGLPELAAKARRGFYHDFQSPLTMPQMQLCADLAAAGTTAAMRVRERVIDGEFDATEEEADAWAEGLHHHE